MMMLRICIRRSTWYCLAKVSWRFLAIDRSESNSTKEKLQVRPLNAQFSLIDCSRCHQYCSSFWVGTANWCKVLLLVGSLCFPSPEKFRCRFTKLWTVGTVVLIPSCRTFQFIPHLETYCTYCTSQTFPNFSSSSRVHVNISSYSPRIQSKSTDSLPRCTASRPWWFTSVPWFRYLPVALHTMDVTAQFQTIAGRLPRNGMPLIRP